MTGNKAFEVQQINLISFDMSWVDQNKENRLLLSVLSRKAVFQYFPCELGMLGSLRGFRTERFRRHSCPELLQ